MRFLIGLSVYAGVGRVEVMALASYVDKRRRLES